MKTHFSNLSPHLFWDVDISNLSFENNKQFVVQRVLEYGLMSDWIQLYRYFGIATIATTAMEIKDLDRKSLTFISALSKIPKEQFKCFTTQQSTPQHWNF